MRSTWRQRVDSLNARLVIQLLQVLQRLRQLVDVAVIPHSKADVFSDV